MTNVKQWLNYRLGCAIDAGRGIKTHKEVFMADCRYCGEVIVRRIGRLNVQFCNKSHEKLWHKENGGNTFTSYTDDTADIVEDRKDRMRLYSLHHPLACAGNKEARRWLRQNMRLRAIWDNNNKCEVRL